MVLNFFWFPGSVIYHYSIGSVPLRRFLYMPVAICDKSPAKICASRCNSLVYIAKFRLLSYAIYRTLDMIINILWLWLNISIWWYVLFFSTLLRGRLWAFGDAKTVEKWRLEVLTHWSKYLLLLSSTCDNFLYGS